MTSVGLRSSRSSDWQQALATDQRLGSSFWADDTRQNTTFGLLEPNVVTCRLLSEGS